MSALDRIGVRVEGVSAGQADATVGNVRAIANEIAALLAQFIATGEAAAIDLRSLPMGPGDYAQLGQLLGEGAVAARIDALGPTEVRETGIAGVWWVRHRNAQDEIVAEFIEIGAVPEILKTPHEDARDGLRVLQDRLQPPA